jgi:hypothetical protein
MGEEVWALLREPFHLAKARITPSRQTSFCKAPRSRPYPLVDCASADHSHARRSPYTCLRSQYVRGVIRRDDQSIRDFASLSGKTVGVQPKTTNEDAVKELQQRFVRHGIRRYPFDVEDTFSSADELMEALIGKQLDLGSSYSVRRWFRAPFHRIRRSGTRGR